MSSKMLCVGVFSVGDMGLGMARLLRAHGYKVATYAADRSESTQARARDNGVALESSIDELVSRCDCVLSIVPPRDALQTARRFRDVETLSTKKDPLYYLDLNAVAPATARDIEQLFGKNPHVRFIDGCIIGPPPRPADTSSGDSDVSNAESGFRRPSILVSGPAKLPDPRLSDVLNISHLEGPIGMASGLKMCFASTTKGLYALAIQSYTTAHRLGVLPELRKVMEKHNPTGLAACDRGVTSVPPKAYRWVGEMQEIATAMAEDGGFERQVFEGISGVYQTVADNPVLGQEKPSARKRGMDVDDFVALLAEGMDSKNQQR